jgi:ParB-like chromosome segregation protein Spo0J
MKQGLNAQPLANIEWIHRDELHANHYNPNHVAPVEMRLLKISILEDGWTQPIVALGSGEIVDGFHRWTTSKDPEVYAMTDGLVPVVRINPSKDQQKMATIRHNRARGSHAVLKMADIVKELIDGDGLSFDEVGQRLQMDDEEVERLYDASGMTVKGSQDGFNNGWIPE